MAAKHVACAVGAVMLLAAAAVMLSDEGGAGFQILAAKKAAAKKSADKNGAVGYDHLLDPQTFPKGQSERGDVQFTSQADGDSIVGNEFRGNQAASGRVGDLAFTSSMKAKHAKLMSLAAQKVKKLKGPFNHANAWKAYDHKLDPQSFPKGQSERGGMHTTTQATGESIVGNEAMASNTADTGIANFKEKGAKVPILADEGSKSVKTKTVEDQNLNDADKALHTSKLLEMPASSTSLSDAHAGNNVLGKQYASNFGDIDSRPEFKAEDPREQMLAGLSVSEDEDPGDFIGLPGATDESTGHGRAMDVNGPGWPPKGKAPGGVPPPHYKNYDHLTRKETRNLRNANMFPRSSIAEVKRLVADNDPAVARRLDKKRAATKAAYLAASKKKKKG